MGQIWRSTERISCYNRNTRRRTKSAYICKVNFRGHVTLTRNLVQKSGINLLCRFMYSVSCVQVHSVMLSVHLFGGLPCCRTPLTEPSSLSYGMRHICPKSSSFLRCIIISARQHAERAICYRPSVRLSVRLSVTRVDQSKTVEVRIMQFSPYSSPIPLVFTV